MSLHHSLSFSSSSSPKKSIPVAAESYVIALAALPSRYAACLSAPGNTIDVYDSFTLQKLYSLPGHDPANSTALKSVAQVAGSSRPTLVSSGKDGSIKVWDERTGSHSIKMTNLGKSRPLLSFDVSPNGLTVAAGTDLQGDDAFILYWDPRQPAAPLRTHSSTHSDDITVLEYSSTSSNVLLSASSDGLISLSNSEEDDEDEAVVHVANWGCSVSQAGWIRSENGEATKIWAGSDMETFSTWSEQLDLLQTQNIREPSIHTGSHTWVTDYLITCHNSNSSELGVFVGSNEGDIALLSSSPAPTSSSWTMHKLWSQGHVGIVRSVLWDSTNHVLVSGGEDAKINVWSGLGSSENEFSLANGNSMHVYMQNGDGESDDAMDVDQVEDEDMNGVSMNGATATYTFRKKRGRDSEGKASQAERDEQAGKRARR
ncbi:hypothetical protein VKT23_002486 [Stygiomarasmius scandens]|uniref:WD40 repeat-like protein n=1 Tax=Marasmiellus scandens TaxID=2682957 RepID=A0ABR1K4R6_9AGAR